MTQRIPYTGVRVETGPVKFGDDWTGYFIRGDNAAGLADELCWMARIVEDYFTVAKRLRQIAAELYKTREYPNLEVKK